MMGRALRLPILLVAAALCTAAFAQSSSVWLEPQEKPRSDPATERIGRILQRAAQCVVSRNRAAAENLLASVPDTHGEWRVLYGPVRSRLQQCVGWMSVSSVLLRGALAEVLYESAHAAVPSGVREAEPMRWPAGHDGAARLAPVYELGRCAAAGHAGDIHRLLETAPFSGEERARLRELMPRLQPCLDRGITFETDRETLRAILAESLYRWARTPDREAAE